jgi:hypothetical protein
MTKPSHGDLATEALHAAGLDSDDVAAWARGRPHVRAAFVEDSPALSEFWNRSAGLLARLPDQSRRNAAERGRPS